MRLEEKKKNLRLGRARRSARRVMISSPTPRAAFTLLEVMVVMGLLGLVFIAGFAAITFNAQASSRLADHTAAFTLVQAKLEAVRAATYNPPNTYFRTNTVWLTNVHSIALSQKGTNYLVSGKLITKIEPVISGHLVTVSGNFPTPYRPTKVELQTVVNKYSGGQ